MRRLASIAALLAAIAVVAAIAGTPALSDDGYRVSAVFDTSKGIIPGQLVKVAGARVGSIADVELTDDYKARIVMDVPQRFAPFREDATCSIQPEGLISENFVQCDPGTPSRRPLAEQEGVGPVVPVEQTITPVAITDLFRIFKADVRQRFTVTMAALGGGLAARGEELNSILLRANPVLRSVRELTDQIDRQREQISSLVRDSDTLVAELARRRGDVREFIDQADRVTRRTASRSTELAEGIRRLPALLDATDPALRQLDELALRGRPLLGDLRAAAPGLERLVDQIAPFSAAARPAVRELVGLSRTGRRTAASAGPVVKLLRTFAASADPVGLGLSKLLVNLRDRGFVEGLQQFAYNAAAGTARYDATSHILPAHLIFTSCSQYAEAPVAGCDAWYGPDRVAAQRGGRRRTTRPRAPAPRPAAPAERPKLPQVPKLPRLPRLPEVLAPLQELTDRLEGRLPAPLRDALSNPPTDLGVFEDLTDFLLR